MPKKLDPKLIASLEQCEVYYISTRYKVPAKTVRKVVRAVGRSRAKVYEVLRRAGYSIPLKNRHK